MRQAGTYSGIRGGGISGKTGPHSFPLARIKKIMKKSSSGDDVKMISGEAPIVLSKACEMFVEEITKRAWMMSMSMSMQGKTKTTLHNEDIATAVMATDVFDFLVTLVSAHHQTTTSSTSA